MACKGCLECLLKLLNFLLTLVGLAMIGYGIYLFVEYKRADDNAALVSTLSADQGLTQLGRPMLIAVSLSENELPTDKTGDFDMIYNFLKGNWNIIKWVALGIVILETGTDFVVTMSWEMVFDVYVSAIIFLLALVVRAANRPAEYDSDDEFITPRQQIRQPLLNRPPAPAAGVPVTGTVDQRPSRNDAWSTRMREKGKYDSLSAQYVSNGKSHHLGFASSTCGSDIFFHHLSYMHIMCLSNFLLSGSDSDSMAVLVCSLLDGNQYGLDTSEFTYNPSESHRFQPVSAQPTEERSCCTIM
ncbi:unnamed protein product [Dovyalis caffra]|uniref:Tobamovirus multiplication protein 2A n=1 Tax=Dovyalis caffra TaxID=77055 RepID=A0AAV1SRM6_9ROSI|nr:unnamed protein product [Dovyalis caffra]